MWKKKKELVVGPALKETTRLEDVSINTVLGQGVLFTGDIKGDGVVRIDGEFHGDIHLQKGVVLGETGKVKGNIHGNNLIIFGEVTGNVYAYEVIVKRGGRIVGDIETEVVEIEKGGSYNGQLKMTISQHPDKISRENVNSAASSKKDNGSSSQANDRKENPKQK